ncbi:MAG: ABC transporter permease [bacterium]|nr:ABC transporter permease [bacterium]
MNDLWRDFRYGLRLLAQRPGFTFVVVLTLALGIGANTAIFSMVKGLLYDIVPFDEPETLMYLTEKSKQFPTGMSVSYPNFLDWRERNRGFEAMAAHRYDDCNLTGVDRPELVEVLHTSASLFSLLRVEPMVGRSFTAEEDEVGGPRVLVISHGFWQRRLGGRDDAVGTILSLDGEPWEVIGVMPPEFTYPIFGQVVDMWQPIGHFAKGWREQRGNHPGIRVTARLAPGMTHEQARADMERIAAELEAEYPDSNTGSGVNVTVLKDNIVRDMRPGLMVLSGSVLLVLLVACVNVANLLLARGAARGQEMAVRGALGAGRWRLARQLLCEGVLLSLAGGAVGLLVAEAGLRVLLATIDRGAVPIARLIGIDGRVLAFTLVVSVATGLLFGMAPVLQSLRSNLVDALKDAVKGSAGLDRRRLRGALVVGEIALALVLLLGAMLFLQTFYRLTVADPGFDPHGVVSFDVTLPEAAYPEKAQRAAFFEQLLERLEALPGVTSAATTLPLLGGWQNSVIAEGQEPPAPGEQLSSEIYRVSPGLFDTLGLRLVRGRLLDEHDREGGKPVAVIDQLYADTFWPGEDPIGRRSKFGTDPANDQPWFEVVGVVNHVKSYGVNEDSRMQLYLPSHQARFPFATVLIKTASDPRQLMPLLGDEVLAVDANQPITRLETLEAMMARRVIGERVVAGFLVAFAGLALVLAAVGIYGVTAYSVTQRHREIGIRMALGARSADVLRLVMAQGLWLVVLGVTFGLALAIPATSLIAGQLYGVGPRDPVTLIGVPLVLALVAVVACALPARRASRVEPVVALHYE